MIISPENRAVFSEQLRRRRGGPNGDPSPTMVINVRVPRAAYEAYRQYAEANGLPVRTVMKAALSVQSRALPETKL